jgi:hypothetical protein
MFLWGRIIVVFHVEDVLYFSCRHRNWIEEAEVFRLDNEYYFEPMQLDAHTVVIFLFLILLSSEPCARASIPGINDRAAQVDS